jgi:hypothetical protein
MKLPSFLAIVPKAMKAWALVLLCCFVLVSQLVAYFTSSSAHLLRITLLYGLGSIVLGCLLAVWFLGLGFIYADARQRGMHPVLWVLVAFLVPHLLGFLLYFVMRQPIAAPCPQCGMPVALTQSFCPSCGAPSPSRQQPVHP